VAYLSFAEEWNHAAAWERLSAWIAERKLAPVIGQVLPLDRAVEGYELLQEGKNYGKVVFKISPE
jgi:NADPH:quinone reductase-like Zn-dependent oxidoreductase